jgi:hypothetical protein
MNLTGLENELQRVFLLIGLQVDCQGKPMFVQHGLVRYLMELEDTFHPGDPFDL